MPNTPVGQGTHSICGRLHSFKRWEFSSELFCWAIASQPERIDPLLRVRRVLPDVQSALQPRLLAASLDLNVNKSLVPPQIISFVVAVSLVADLPPSLVQQAN